MPLSGQSLITSGGAASPSISRQSPDAAYVSAGPSWRGKPGRNPGLVACTFAVEMPAGAAAENDPSGAV